jgi:hypothetical protein
MRENPAEEIPHVRLVVGDGDSERVKVWHRRDAIQNPKSEARNSKQIPIAKLNCPKVTLNRESCESARMKRQIDFATE